MFKKLVNCAERREGVSEKEPKQSREEGGQPSVARWRTELPTKKRHSVKRQDKMDYLQEMTR